MYCLDTDAIINFLRDRNSDKIKELSLEGISTTSLNVCELYKGAYLSKSPEMENAIIIEFLKKLDIINIDSVSCELYGKIFAFLEKEGKPTQEFDLLVGCICISQGKTLVTGNEKHFLNVPGLKMKRW